MFQVLSMGQVFTKLLFSPGVAEGLFKVHFLLYWCLPIHLYLLNIFSFASVTHAYMEDSLLNCCLLFSWSWLMNFFILFLLKNGYFLG